MADVSHGREHAPHGRRVKEVLARGLPVCPVNQRSRVGVPEEAREKRLNAPRTPVDPPK